MDFFNGFWFWLGKIFADAVMFFVVILAIFIIGVYVLWVDSKRPCYACKGLGGVEGLGPGAHCPVCFKKRNENGTQ